MTRKHYKVAAESLATARKKINCDIDDDNARTKALQVITQLESDLMLLFMGDNVRFSVTKFLAASR
jgi:hypothetical protein